jgi:hypothetical protein
VPPADERRIPRETQGAVAVFGGRSVWIPYLGNIGPVEAVRQDIPARWKSPDYTHPTATFTMFLMSALMSARRFAHASLPCWDRGLHVPPGLERFPTDDTIPDLFDGSAQAKYGACSKPCPSGRWRVRRLAPKATPQPWIPPYFSAMQPRNQPPGGGAFQIGYGAAVTAPADLVAPCRLGLLWRPFCSAFWNSVVCPTLQCPA